MPERDVCLVVPASYWFEMHGERPDPDLEQVEYKLRCQIIAQSSVVVLATICELLRLAPEPRPGVTADRRVLKALGVIVTVDTANKEVTIMGTLQGYFPKLGYVSCTDLVGGPWITLWMNRSRCGNFAH